jgi:hypothetical protein
MHKNTIIGGNSGLVQASGKNLGVFPWMPKTLGGGGSSGSGLILGDGSPGGF